MSLFPKCTFEYYLSAGSRLLAGQRNEGKLILNVPEHIPRAEHINLALSTSAWAGYGSGKNRRVVRQPLLLLPMRVDLPATGMPPGRHEYPFVLDLPAWLPPAYQGPDCGIVHELKTELDVDWAIDPECTVHPKVLVPPRSGRRITSIVRSPNGFHESIVLEVTLDSAVIGEDEPLAGKLALRAGATAKFDAVVLTVNRAATVPMGHGDRRRGDLAVVRIPAASLVGGHAVPFVFPPSEDPIPTFASPQINVDYFLNVSVDIPWGFDPEMEIPFTVLPHGSRIEGEGSDVPLGGERLRQMAHYVATRAGLAEGNPPVLAHGKEGPIAFSISDAPQGGALGVEAVLVFPSLGLDLRMRPLGMLDGFSSSPLLPPDLRDKYHLRCEAPQGRYAREPLGEAEFHRLLTGLSRADAVRMTDHHLAFHFPIEDDAEKLVGVASFVVRKAKVLAEVVSGLPFPRALEHTRPAWEAAAAERGAILVPSGPTLSAMTMAVRTIGGEERIFEVRVGTDWSGVPHAYVEVQCGRALLPPSASSMLEGQTAHPMLTSLRGTFPRMALEGPSLVRLHTVGTVDDPRALFPAVEAIIAWVLDIRGERRADAPYR